MDWPLNPWTIYHGIPIQIERGGTLAGYPEPAESYLEYCIENCQWRKERYKNADDATIRRIVRDFAASIPWPEPLDWVDVDQLLWQTCSEKELEERFAKK